MDPLSRPSARSIAALLLLALAGSAHAGDEALITDRPDQTESSSVVARGRVQLETGVVTSHDDERGVEIDTTAVGGTLVRIGLTNRVEARVGWNGYVDTEIEMDGFEFDDSGAADTSLGSKIYLVEEAGRRPECALIVAASLPTGDDEISSNRVDPDFRFSCSNGLTERLSIGYNLGTEWETEEGDDGDRDTLSSAIYTAALGIGISERFGAYVELFGDMGLSASGGPAHSFNGGVTWLLSDRLQLDASGGVGLSSAADDWFLGTGLSVRFPE
jgi:hypothetical protein